MAFKKAEVSTKPCAQLQPQCMMGLRKEEEETWLVVGVLHPGNIQGPISVGEDTFGGI